MPVISGFTLPSKYKDPETNAMFKLVTFYPYACTATTACSECDPCECLHDDSGFTLRWDAFWKDVVRDAELADLRIDSKRRWPAFTDFPGDGARLYMAWLTREVVSNMDTIQEQDTKHIGATFA